MTYKSDNYQAAIDFLYNQAPMFQNVGKAGYKADLENTFYLDKYLGVPHKYYRTIHIGGTNGKGSVSHILSAILQAAGYKVGLYTSPHLKDFRERIRINHRMIPKQRVSTFIDATKQFVSGFDMSFFEITTALAFKYFAEQWVDFAIVEVGLGGRLDCTNIINPILSVITNVSLDHTDILGDTLEKIAEEKAGIIKPKTPIIIGETQTEIKNIFIEKAKKASAEIIFADEDFDYRAKKASAEIVFDNEKFVNRELPVCELKGIYQQKNVKTVLAAVEKLKELGINISDRAQERGLKHVIRFTGFQGRWQIIGKNPTVICDTAHNEGGFALVVEQINAQTFNKLHIVFGITGDKRVDAVLALLPKNAIYYFTKAQIPRAMDEVILQQKAKAFELYGDCYTSVSEAINAAKNAASQDDFIYVGGSTFVVAEAI
jgi:dihydrofolate synthase/folylpolyglutamate synthase